MVSKDEKLKVDLIEDTEAGLNVPPIASKTLEELVKGDENLHKQEAPAPIEINDKVEVNSEEADFQKAIDEAAEQRAKSPFEVAAMQHARMYGPFVQKLDHISGGAAKRILRYLVGYPFFVDKLNPQNAEVESLAYIADKLGQTKYTILLIQAMEQEAKAQQTLAEHAKIQELDLEGKGELTEELLNEAAEIAANKIGE